MTLPPVIHCGSVKHVRGERGDTPWYFEFTDNYSVFDWGIMPDTLEKKGIAQAQFARLVFEYLKKEKGIKNTSLGMEREDVMKIQPMKAHMPPLKSGIFDYSFYKTRPMGTMIPLEVVFRFGVPPGSSLLKSSSLYRSLGLNSRPRPWERFSNVIIEFTSKREPEDRHLDEKEAREISGMSSKEFDSLLSLTKKTADALKELFFACSLELWDGKFEFAFGENREILLADSIGPDELRISYGRHQISKESIRRHYASTDWYQSLEKAKKTAREKKIPHWKRICPNKPPSLPENKRQMFSMIYQSLADTIALRIENKTIFENSWSLRDLKSSLERDNL